MTEAEIEALLFDIAAHATEVLPREACGLIFLRRWALLRGGGWIQSDVAHTGWLWGGVDFAESCIRLSARAGFRCLPSELG